MTHVVHNISFSILMQDPLTKQIVESGDEEAFEVTIIVTGKLIKIGRAHV